MSASPAEQVIDLRRVEAEAKSAAIAAGEAFRIARAEFQTTAGAIDGWVNHGDAVKVAELGALLPGLAADAEQKERLHRTATNAYKHATRDRALVERGLIQEESVAIAADLDAAAARFVKSAQVYRTHRAHYIACTRDGELPNANAAIGFARPVSGHAAKLVKSVEGGDAVWNELGTLKIPS